MTREAVWNYNGESGPEWEPGGWGGHLAFAKAYDDDYIEILTWGGKISVSNNFIEKYADEAWGVIDSFEDWRISQALDVELLKRKLWQITSKAA
jgi:hypothetical protein